MGYLSDAFPLTKLIDYYPKVYRGDTGRGEDVLKSKGSCAMRIVLMFVIALISLALAIGAFASGPEQVVARHINCCMADGQCLKTRRHHCEQKGGRVVENCKDCKAQWDPNKAEK